METLTFYSRLFNQKVDIDVLLKSYLNECFPELREVFHLKESTELKFFIITNNGRPKLFNQFASIDYVKNEVLGCRHIEVVWKREEPLNVHGKQVQDLSSSELGTVVSGYKRMVSSNPNAGGAFIGDPNGASIYIPAGALGQGSESREISIKTVMVDNSKINLPNGTINVTRSVISDPNKVNKTVNNE